ncbi:unnamed protein product [Moneuplotes crassus]|uniref:Mitochondrial carrier protein n=1 Tax=Euplotes crassus TaxID=5936 RepID=A0AAD1XMQ1_EUPCR|nr:unnamed protein product [Moneuplotes crassus]
MKDSKTSLSAFSLNFISGTIAGICGTVVGHPLDTIKTKIQLSQGKYGGIQTFNNIVVREVKGSYSKAFLKLFNGITYPIIGNAPIVATIFSVNTLCNNLFQGSDIPQTCSIFISGFIAGASISIFLTPTELLKIRKQAMKLKKITYPQIIKQQYKSLGIKGLYQGYCITLIKCTFPYGIFFVTNYKLREIFNLDLDQNTSFLLLVKKVFAAGIGGQCHWLCAYPLDVIKSNIQNSRNNLRIIHTARRLYMRHGLLHFYKGISVVLLRTFPFTAINLLVYESISSKLTKLAFQ